MTDKKAAPAQEQPSNQSPNDTTTDLADAIRLACYANRIDHDVSESIVGGVFARYRPRPDAPLREVIESLEPGTLVQTEFRIHDVGDYGFKERSKEQAEKLAAAIEATLDGTQVVIREEHGPKLGFMWLKVFTEEELYNFIIGDRRENPGFQSGDERRPICNKLTRNSC